MELRRVTAGPRWAALRVSARPCLTGRGDRLPLSALFTVLLNFTWGLTARTGVENTSREASSARQHRVFDRSKRSRRAHPNVDGTSGWLCTRSTSAPRDGAGRRGSAYEYSPAILGTLLFIAHAMSESRRSYLCLDD